MKELLIIYYKKAISGIAQWYWSLDKKRRHRVGWALVVAALLVLGGSIWGIGYGCYSAGVWVSDRVTSWFQDDPKAYLAERDIVKLPEYAATYWHRSFKCGELNKNRNVRLSKDFNDLNDTQLVAARRLGVVPMEDRTELEKKKGKLVELVDTRYYCIDRMTHSSPYLVPDAADFLTALGERWHEYHGTNSRFIITSCLRTAKDIKKLRRTNVNSSKESCHRFGTTFDITYVRFDRHGRVRDGKLKADLARALMDMKESGHCYVKYEYKQSCFHVTVRPK